MKKLLLRFDIHTILFSFLALFSLSLPLFATTLTGEAETGDILIRGYNLSSFTSFGFVIHLTPLMLPVLAKLHTKIRNKHLIVFGLLLLALIGYNDGINHAREWIYGESRGFVRSYGTALLYPVLISAAGFSLLLHLHYTDLFDAYKEKYKEDFDFDTQYYDFMAEDTPIGTWDEILSIAKSMMHRSSYQTWIAPCQFMGISGHSLTLGVPNAFFREMIQNRYLDVLESAAETVLRHPTEIRITITDHMETE